MTKVDWHPFNKNDPKTYPPEKYVDYFVTIEDEDDDFVRYTDVCMFFGNKWNVDRYPIIAWAELPEPYQTKDN